MTLEFKEDFKFGVEVVDGQHRELFDRLNTFIEAVEAGRGGEEVLTVFEFLAGYTANHFKAEEQLQQENAYPHAQLHREEHQSFLRNLEKLKEKGAADGATDKLALLASRNLVQWLVQHICKTDRDFAAFLKERGTCPEMRTRRHYD